MFTDATRCWWSSRVPVSVVVVIWEREVSESATAIGYKRSVPPYPGRLPGLFSISLQLWRLNGLVQEPVIIYLFSTLRE